MRTFKMLKSFFRSGEDEVKNMKSEKKCVVHNA